MPILLLIVLSAILSCSSPPPGSWKYGSGVSAIEAVSLECGAGLTEGIEKWSSAGKARGCYKNDKRHGRWIFWEEGYVNLEGYYREGVKDGPWTVFHRDGSVYARIVFEDGKKIEKNIY